MKIKEYQTTKVSVKDIKIDGDNPNRMTPNMRKRLETSLKEFGNTQDIIVDSNTMILA